MNQWSWRGYGHRGGKRWTLSRATPHPCRGVLRGIASTGDPCGGTSVRLCGAGPRVRGLVCNNARTSARTSPPYLLSPSCPHNSSVCSDEPHPAASGITSDPDSHRDLNKKQLLGTAVERGGGVDWAPQTRVVRTHTHPLTTTLILLTRPSPKLPPTSDPVFPRAAFCPDPPMQHLSPDAAGSFTKNTTPTIRKRTPMPTHRHGRP